jgi:hypothetical protein
VRDENEMLLEFSSDILGSSELKTKECRQSFYLMNGKIGGRTGKSDVSDR